MTEPLEPHTDNPLVGSVNALSGLVIVLILAILSFHPWFMAAVDRAVDVLPLLVLVLIFVYVARPLVHGTHKLLARFSRGRVSDERALFMTYLILLGLIAILLALVVPKLVREAQSLAEDLPGYSLRMREAVLQYKERLAAVIPEHVQNRVGEVMQDIGKYAGDLLKQGVTWVGVFSQTLIWVLSAVVVVPLLGFYFLEDAYGIFEFLLRLVNPRRRPKVRAICLDMHEAMENFVKGQAILCLAIGGVTTCAMLLVLPQFAIGLGLVAGVTEAIPVVGPILGAIPAVIIAFAAKGWSSALIVMLLYVGIQQLESVFLVPRVMGKSLGLHPLSLMIGMMMFGNLLGFWGVLLAAPLVAAVKVLVEHLLMHPPDPTTPTPLPEPAAASPETPEKVEAPA